MYLGLTKPRCCMPEQPTGPIERAQSDPCTSGRWWPLSVFIPVPAPCEDLRNAPAPYVSTFRECFSENDKVSTTPLQTAEARSFVQSIAWAEGFSRTLRFIIPAEKTNSRGCAVKIVGETLFSRRRSSVVETQARVTKRGGRSGIFNAEIAHEGHLAMGDRSPSREMKTTAERVPGRPVRTTSSPQRDGKYVGPIRGVSIKLQEAPELAEIE